MVASSKAGSRAVLASAALVSLAATLLSAPVQAQAGGALFQTSDRCVGCHNGLLNDRGEDRSIGSDWASSLMANAARDPYWLAAVRRETVDHPSASAAIQDECSKCHMPMDRFQAHTQGGKGRVFFPPAAAAAAAPSPLALDGVSCSLCHQITAKGLGQKASLVGGFDVDATRPLGQRYVFGPYAVDAGRTTIMRSSSQMRPTQSPHLGSAEMCATCHTLYTHSLDAQGKVVGELPEQVPYLEWRFSSYRKTRPCQSCHMPTENGQMAISSVLGQPRPAFSRHQFRGGNFFVQTLFGRYRAELGVTATAQAMTAAAERTRRHLTTAAAKLSLSGTISEQQNGEAPARLLEAVVKVTNWAGHKLPTAYPSRRVWVHFSVNDANGKLLFESGALGGDGAIAGNDNDADPTRYEPHHELIESPEDVQIYEAILAGPDGAVTTGLLTATQYVKDNRLLPLGFAKGRAMDDIAVRGAAFKDGDFRGGEDHVRYAIPVPSGGPFQVTAELWYQPIGYRWALNLADTSSPETNRFVAMYRATSAASAQRLASTSITVELSD